MEWPLYVCEVASVGAGGGAEGTEATGGAVGRAGGADVAAVEDEPVMSRRDIGCRDVTDELLLDAVGRGASVRDEAETVTDTEDMGVDSHGWLVPHDGLHDVGCLAPYAGQTYELVQRIGNLSSKVADEHACHADEMACLIVGIGYGLDVFENLLGRGGGHSFGGGVGRQKGGRHHIDALVRALRGEDDGREQTERGCIVQLRLGYGHRLAKVGQDACVSLFLSH